MDDGSTDDTPAVLADYAGRVQVVHSGHGGLSAARNLCLAHACGEWVAFHDADDVGCPDRLASHLAFLAAHPGFEAVFANGQRMQIDDSACPRVVPAAMARRCAGRAITARDLFDGYPVYFQGALVPRGVFEACGRFDPMLRVQPDIEYGYRLFTRCRAAFDDRVVFHYRWHTTNNSGNWRGSREDIARILERLPETAPEAARAIGRRRLHARVARHWFRIGRRALAGGDSATARAAFARAAQLRPLHPRYQWMRLRTAP